MEKQNLYIFNFSIFITKIIGLIAITTFALNYFFESQVIFKSEINGAFKVNRILTEIHTNEIPIFGSSRAEGNFVPSIIDSVNCFNYGIAGTQANIWLFFLEEELKKEKSTPIIINYDLIGLSYSDGDIGNYIPNWKSVKSIIRGQGEFYYGLPFVKYFGQYEKYLKYYLNEKINLTKVTDCGGSFEKNALTEERFQELVKKRQETKSSFNLDRELLLKFNKLIESTERKVFLVIAPYHKSCFNEFDDIEVVNDYLKKLNKINNIEIIDLRSFIEDDSMFMDTSHLNYEGAVLFSQKLKELLDK